MTQKSYSEVLFSKGKRYGAEDEKKLVKCDWNSYPKWKGNSSRELMQLVQEQSLFALCLFRLLELFNLFRNIRYFTYLSNK